MTPWLDHPVLQALASALLHFLWQGSVIALVAFAWWRAARPSAPARYFGGVIALAVMLAMPLITMAYLAARTAAPPAARVGVAPTERPGPVFPASAAPAMPRADGAHAANSNAGFQSALRPAVIVPLWLGGVLLLSGRLLGGWIVARRLTRRHVAPVAPDIASLASQVAGRLALDRLVRVVESSAVALPVMIGWIRPMILLPTAVLTALTPAQVEALLAHELAHVRRHDYLVNLFQSVVETLLFYHPGVWWVSRQVRAAREHCCDDLVVTVCDRRTYIAALTDLAALGAPPHVALAATDGPLLLRVKRMLGQAHAERPAVGFWLPVALLALAAAPFLPAVMASPAAHVQISGGVDAGVPGGVRGGVTGGVSGGVAGGVPGGVPAEISERIPDGADATAADGSGTTAAGQQPAPRQATGSEASAQRAAGARRTEMLELLEREHAAYKEYLIKARQMEQQRLELELQAARSSLDSAVREQEIELQNLQRQHERARGQVDVGMADPLELERIKGALAVAETRLQSIRAELESRTKQAALQIEQAKQKVEFELRQLQIDHARRQLELQARRQEFKYAFEPDLQATIEADQTGPIAAGDVLRIEIAGEPALPRAYRVAADGTITLPLLGSLAVEGRTARHVREEIGRLLVERKLKDEPSVMVVRRHRP